MTLQRRRMFLLGMGVAVWAVIIVARLVQIQIVRHEDYVQRAARQQERTITLTPMRGSVYDARGRLLAESITSNSIYADPQAIEDPKAVASALAKVDGLHLDRDDLERRLRRGGEFVWVARQVSDPVWAAVSGLNLPGIHSLDEHRRAWPNGQLAASVLGWVGIDGEGLAGVEHALNRYVRGNAGVVTLLRDARRGMYQVGGEGGDQPVNGLDVYLTVDEVIQHLAERALEKTVEQYRARSGVVVVMDPRDGSVLAMASSPSFDPNRFGRYPSSAWRNRAVQDVYEPGSTFKIVTASAGLEEGIVTPSQVIDCQDGSIQVANIRIREHDGNAYGLMSFEDVIAHSSNVGTIKVALSLGPERLYDYARRFGFGQTSGIQLPGEAAGILRPTEKWSKVSNAAIAIGQEVAVTPLQMAHAMCIVANGGRSVPPHIVDRIVDPDGSVVWAPPAQKPVRVISERTAAVMNEILKGVVDHGTGQHAALPEYVVAGKTGTAQKAGPGGYLPNASIASFIGYVPADRPRLVVLVVIDEPHGSQYGGTVAAPAFREIAEGSLRYLGVEPAFPQRQISLDDNTRLAKLSQPSPLRERSARAGGILPGEGLQ